VKISDAEFKLLSEQALWGILIHYDHPYRMNARDMLSIMSNAMLMVAGVIADAD